jgi:hypothetical protein
MFKINYIKLRGFSQLPVLLDNWPLTNIKARGIFDEPTFEISQRRCRWTIANFTIVCTDCIG